MQLPRGQTVLSLRTLFAFALILFVASCSKPDSSPPPAPPAIEFFRTDEWPAPVEELVPHYAMRGPSFGPYMFSHFRVWFTAEAIARSNEHNGRPVDRLLREIDAIDKEVDANFPKIELKVEWCRFDLQDFPTELIADYTSSRMTLQSLLDVYAQMMAGTFDRKAFREKIVALTSATVKNSSCSILSQSRSPRPATTVSRPDPFRSGRSSSEPRRAGSSTWRMWSEIQPRVVSPVAIKEPHREATSSRSRTSTSRASNRADSDPEP
jgi:hypothetical protein